MKYPLSKRLVYCHKMNIIMIMSAISPSTQPASCHTSDHHCGVRTAYQLIILFKQKITCPTTTTGSDLREGERWNTIILSSVLGPQLSSMLDVGYGNWQVDKCSTNVWIGDPLFMSTLLLNIETICQHSNMLSLSSLPVHWHKISLFMLNGYSPSREEDFPH